MKLSIVVGVLNQFDLAHEAIRSMVENLERPEETEIIVIDNGSDEKFSIRDVPAIGLATVVRNENNTGNYPMFKQALEIAKGEIVAFLHSDVFVWQKGWDTAVRAQFDSRPELGLIGFIGSTELDFHGGRGVGTTSNMQGRTVTSYGYDAKRCANCNQFESDHATGNAPDCPIFSPRDINSWTGSAGHIHGKQEAGMTVDGSVVDGCVMIFRKSVLAQIGFKDLPPHHFYDRIMSCQVIEAGYKVGILGIEFDHISGQTANTQSKYQETSKAWFKEHMGIDTPQQWAEVREEWVKRGRGNPSLGKVPDQWDYCSYLEAEYRFLKEYRDDKRMVPLIMGKRIN